MFAWMGPFIGALIRPFGGMMADKMGGAKVTQIISFVMVVSALGCGLLHPGGLCLGDA